jgi:DnaJ homolog subfamily C member 28
MDSERGNRTPYPHHERDGADASEHHRDLGQSWADLVEKRIRAAQERGEFSNLPGSGQPLQPDVNPLAGDRTLAYSILKANRVAPPEIELGREVDADHSRAEAVVAALRRRRDDLLSRRVGPFLSERRAYNVLRANSEARYAAMLRAANSAALTLNITAPSALHRSVVDIEERLVAFRQEFPPLAERSQL